MFPPRWKPTRITPLPCLAFVALRWVHGNLASFHLKLTEGPQNLEKRSMIQTCLTVVFVGFSPMPTNFFQRPHLPIFHLKFFQYQVFRLRAGFLYNCAQGVVGLYHLYQIYIMLYVSFPMSLFAPSSWLERRFPADAPG